MMKLLYILPVLAVLALFSMYDVVAEQTIEERIDRMKEQISTIEEKIANADPVRQADRIAKWEDKIENIQNRIDMLEGNSDRTTIKNVEDMEDPEEVSPSRQVYINEDGVLWMHPSQMAGGNHVYYGASMYGVEFVNRHTEEHSLHVSLMSFEHGSFTVHSKGVVTVQPGEIEKLGVPIPTELVPGKPAYVVFTGTTSEGVLLGENVLALRIVDPPVE